MSIGPTGKNLIFLISQPRAGSTLLQNMLSNHPEVFTTPEPWTMLHPVYALRSHGYEAEYNAESAWLAVHEFIEQLPQKRDTYIEALRHMQRHLYEAALAPSAKTFFLDKTPRYYHIIPELVEIFPDATFIFLLRNPLAVANSVANTWLKGNWFKLYRYRADLLDALPKLRDGIELLGDRALTIHYEQLLQQPEAELQKICAHIGVEFQPEFIHYSTTHAPEKGFGYKDQKGLFHQGKPNSNNLDAWVKDLKEAQRWRVMHDYLNSVNPEVFEALGYPVRELLDLLHQHRPGALRLWFTFSMRWLSRRSEERRAWNYEKQCVALIRAIQRRGIGGAALRLSQKTVGVKLPSSTGPEIVSDG